MKYLCLALLSCAIFCSGCIEEPLQKEEPWVPLFNGTDLTGWTPKFSGYPAVQNYKNTFSASDSMIHVSYAEYDSFRNEFGHLFYEKLYSYFRLRMDYRFTGEPTPGAPNWAIRNNGLMFLAQSPESMGLEQDFPVCIEFQFLGANGDEPRPTAGVCTPGTDIMMGDSLVTEHCIASSAKTYHGENWVSIELAVLPDGNIYHLVGGDTVMHYARPVISKEGLPEGFPMKAGERLSQGYLALQAETHNTDFRRIRIQEIK